MATAATAVGGVVAACDAVPSDTLNRARKQGRIVVGYAGEAPHSFKRNGQLVGAAIAVDGAAYRQIGIGRIDGLLVSFDDLIPGLRDGRFDAVSADMSILPDRCDDVAFSVPTFRYTTALMVPSGNPSGLHDLDDVRRSGSRVAVARGTVEEEYCRKLDIRATTVPSPQAGMDSLSAGSVDSVAASSVTLRYMKGVLFRAPVTVTAPFVQVIDGVAQVGAGGAAFRKGDTDLLHAFDAQVEPIVTDRQRYLSLVAEYGFTAAEMPDPDWTTAQFCRGPVA